MKEIKIIVDGEEITTQVSEESLKVLLSEPTLTGFERRKKGQSYYNTESTGEVCETCEIKSPMDDKFWEAADYYSDKFVAEWCAKADKLMRRIRRFTAMKNACTRNDGCVFMLSRCEDRRFRALKVEAAHRIPFTPIFYNYESAKEAIDIFGDDLEEIYNTYPAYI